MNHLETGGSIGYDEMVSCSIDKVFVVSIEVLMITDYFPSDSSMHNYLLCSATTVISSSIWNESPNLTSSI